MQKTVTFDDCFCDPDWIRTNDPQLRRLMLYPAELPDRYFYFRHGISMHDLKWAANIGNSKKNKLKKSEFNFKI